MRGVDMDDISGLGLLLQKLEYNALNPKARRLSDFGVPFRVVKYYDSEEKGIKNFGHLEIFEIFLSRAVKNRHKKRVVFVYPDALKFITCWKQPREMKNSQVFLNAQILEKLLFFQKLFPSIH